MQKKDNKLKLLNKTKHRTKWNKDAKVIIVITIVNTVTLVQPVFTHMGQALACSQCEPVSYSSSAKTIFLLWIFLFLFSNVDITCSWRSRGQVLM